MVVSLNDVEELLTLGAGVKRRRRPFVPCICVIEARESVIGTSTFPSRGHSYICMTTSCESVHRVGVCVNWIAWRRES